MKYYIKLSYYYVCILVKYSTLCVAKPLALLSSNVDSTVSEWEPNRPLHTTDELDPLQDPDNLGI
jgi:hypothetical protein